MKLINILFFLFFSLSLNATVEKKLNLAQSIAALVANPVYQVDTEQVEITIRSIVQDNITIKAIKIKDADDGEIIVEFFRQKDKLVFGKNIPNSILEGKSLVSDIIFEDENIGDIVVYFNDVNDIGLTLKEKQWIETHTVKIGVEQWSPVVFSNDGKDIDGITGDFTKKIIELTGLKVEIVNDNWDILLKDFKDKKLDLLPATYHTDKRTKFGLYSDPYFKMKNAIYLKDSNTKITSLKDLEGDTVAIPKGYGTIDKIEKEFPKIKIVLTKDLDDSINRVLNGSVTAFYEGQIATQVKIKSELIEGLKSIPVTEFKSPTLHYFSKIDEPILQSIIQKALNSLDYTTRNMITSKWVTQHNTLNITDDEQKWLDKEETINYVYDPDWAPFEWTNEVGEHVGIIADILHIVSNSSGVKFQAVPTVKWSDAVAKMENNEVDMYSAVVQNERREKYAKFSSKNIYSSPAVIVTKVDDDTVYLDIQSALKTKNVGLAKGYAIGDYVKKTYPDLKFTTVESIVDGFEKLEHGDIDVFVLNAATAQYFIKQKGYDDIRIATKIDFSFDLKIAIQKNMPQEVLSILDKAINNISQKELNDIYYKWTNVQAKVKTDWVLVGQIASVVFIIILFILWNNRKLKLMVESKTSEIRMLLKAFDKNVIASKTDKNGIITYASEAFCEISGYTQEELIGQPHSLMRDPDMPKEIFEDLWKTIKEEKVWRGEVKNRKKDGGYYWVDVIITPECHDADKICGYSAIRQDITSKKEVENLTQNLEKKVEEQTKDLKKQLRIVKIAERKQNELFVELADEKNFINTIMDSQENFVITSDGKCLKTANKAFYDFFEVKDTDEFIEKFGNCICDTFDTTAPKEYIQKTMGDEKWLDYVNNRPHQVHKTMIIQNEKEYIFTITSEKLIIKGHELKTAIFTDITKMEKAQKEIEATHKHTRESIEYASMIQGALIPEKGIMESFFKDHFVTWVPKDTVGGDIWLFSQLRHKDECLLFFIDCTGHGVPGAFVTMIVKAIEREIVSNLKKHPEFEISPAIIMGYFNNTMKKLLKQETKDSLSNAGWDGGIIYYNRRTQILKFAGAETPLFYMDENQEFQTVKGTRYSVGYKKCAMDYEYKETIIPVKEGMKFYCTTDGYLDQNGGEKDFPFGKKRFTNIIKEHHKSPMAELQTIFQMQMLEYENTIPNNDRNDDMTVIAFEIGKQSEFKEDISEEIVKYEGVMTQNVIAAAIENIEAKIENMGMMGTVSTITIEYCQNMMNYSKNEEKDSRQIVPAGEIKVQNFNNEYYEIIATNIVSTEDKEKIEPKLIEIQDLDKAGIKKRYRELRKSGQNTHEKGGGIGMYEIAKVSDEIEYEFNAINDDKYYFTMKSVVKTKVIEKRNKVD